MANETIFRDKSIERISSPEQLNDYVKLTNPGVWFVSSAILIILIGTIVFGTVGHIDSSVPSALISDGETSVCLVKREYGEKFTDDMHVKVDGTEYNVSLKAAKPVAINPDVDSYTLFVGNMEVGEWVYEIDVDGQIPEGVYEARLVTERISPLSFIFGGQ
ncbi:hypothetical protein [Butyrivibrio sp. INlla16]|jgi:hypothetical protein|uniref:hypothetical protein n=1 Tax=Butyrivibrio sp. INlla16 TaxID=1520807 RepID=UPI000882B014|nr:hypothetical protein [Butyrivibrio sp. INlla16]MBE5824597.1 hypothetical protein [Butyrivibrio sp.]SDB43772.1 hypothetical protein SAMN02910263_02123 [Butyrivibrio sp. INlla16]